MKRKSYVKFLFSHFFVVPWKGFMKLLKAFIKLSEAPQRSVKIKTYFNTTFRNAWDVKG